MSRARRAAAALLAFAFLATACGPQQPTPTPRFPVSKGPAPTPTPFATKKLTWTACHSAFQCAMLAVPLNYADLSMGTISIALVREPARDQAHRAGSVLVNPGGPGGSGIDFLTQSAGIFQNLNQHFDIVSFDPRGVGASTPVRCVTSSGMDDFIDVNPEPATPVQIAAAVSSSRAFAAGCAQMSSRILPYVGTVNAAHDMDLIRDAVGDEKLTYIGFSYGTFLGATYATLFPTHVRALVLDGAIDPNLSSDQIAAAQATGFENNLQAFLSYCAGLATCGFHSNGNPGPALDSLMSSLTSTPLQVGKRKLGIGEAYLGVLAALYSSDTWRLLGLALSDAQHGDGSLLLTLSDLYDGRQPDGTYTNELESNTAINCDDGPAPGDLAHLEALAAQLQKVSPHFGVASAYGPLTCDYWPVQATGRIAPSDPGAPPVLVIGGTNDPATPYAWAQALARELSQATLVTRTGNGHVSYDKSSCIRTIVDAYLNTPAQLPAAGTTCPTDG